jgi:hypothetical protein
VSAPGVASGAVNVDATTRFGGGDVNMLYNVHRGGGWTVNLLAGYRYLQLDESLSIGSDSTLLVTTTYTDSVGNILATASPGSSVTVLDQFNTRNQYNAGQIGANFQYLLGRWAFSGAAKVAFGDTHETVTVNGNTVVYPINGSPVPLSGGNYATLQTGRYVQDRFAIAPEAQLNVGFQITPWMRTQLGYSFIYLSNAVRPGKQIDNVFDGMVHPTVPMVNSSFWAQGINLGVLFSF